MKDIKKYFKTKIKKVFNPLTMLHGAIFITINYFMHLFALANINVSLAKEVVLFCWVGYFITPIMVWLLIYKHINISGIEKEYNIYSINNETRLKGSFSGGFILGCGSVRGDIEQKDYYLFYKEGEFGYEKSKISIEGIEIIMRDDIKPSYKEIWVEGEIRKFMFVPEKTIKKRMELD